MHFNVSSADTHIHILTQALSTLAHSGLPIEWVTSAGIKFRGPIESMPALCTQED